MVPAPAPGSASLLGALDALPLQGCATRGMGKGAARETRVLPRVLALSRCTPFRAICMSRLSVCWPPLHEAGPPRDPLHFTSGGAAPFLATRLDVLWPSVLLCRLIKWSCLWRHRGLSVALMGGPAVRLPKPGVQRAHSGRCAVASG